VRHSIERKCTGLLSLAARLCSNKNSNSSVISQLAGDSLGLGRREQRLHRLWVQWQWSSERSAWPTRVLCRSTARLGLLGHLLALWRNAVDLDQPVNCIRPITRAGGAAEADSDALCLCNFLSFCRSINYTYRSVNFTCALLLIIISHYSYLLHPNRVKACSYIFF